MTGAEIKNRLRNGLGRQILCGVAVLMISGTLGWAGQKADELSDSVSSLEATVRAMRARDDRQDARLDRHDGRITYLERRQ